MNTIKQPVKVGTRSSALALRQVEEIRAYNLGCEFDVVSFKTQGDVDQTTPLTDEVADNFFTDTLDQAVLDGDIDIAIHSAKDLPQELSEGLKIFALTESVDDTDCFSGRCAFSELPKGAKVGTSSSLRTDGLKEINPYVETVSIRGTIEERLKLVDEGKLDGILVATIALKRLGLEDRITDIMPWEGFPLQGQLAVVGRKGDVLLEEVFKEIDVRRRYGHVQLVGAGPGDPDLITVKAINALKGADCVFYDYLSPKSVLDYAPRAERVYVGKRKGAHALPQRELSKLLRLKAMEGKTVVRLKGGDPLIFGRGADEIDYLHSYHIPVDIIPGVSSATAIPSSLRIPLTARDLSSSVAFVSGHAKDESRTQPQPIQIPDVDTIVFLMGLTKLPEIIEALKEKGWRESTPMIVISRGTRSDEQIASGTIADIVQKVEEADLKPPALMVVGEINRYYQPKATRREKILYTGTNPEKYQALGEIIHFPMIEITKAEMDEATLAEIKTNLEKYHIVLLTSRFAVKYFFELLKQEEMNADDLAVKDFICIGKDTAEALKAHGFEPALVSAREHSEGLFEEIMQKFDLKDKWVLFPRSSLSNPYLQNHLEKSGANVTILTVYQNVKPQKKELPEDAIKNIFFTSPSTVNNFLNDYHQIPKEWRIYSRGPLTQRRLEEAGYHSEVVIHE